MSKRRSKLTSLYPLYQKVVLTRGPGSIHSITSAVLDQPQTQFPESTYAYRSPVVWLFPTCVSLSTLDHRRTNALAPEKYNTTRKTRLKIDCWPSQHFGLTTGRSLIYWFIECDMHIRRELASVQRQDEVGTSDGTSLSARAGQTVGRGQTRGLWRRLGKYDVRLNPHNRIPSRNRTRKVSHILQECWNRM